MSEAQQSSQQSYISRVRLKGYKSIIDTEVALKPGLNIIIGANGSGKTNFVEFMEGIINRQHNGTVFEASYTISIEDFPFFNVYKIESFPDVENRESYKIIEKVETYKEGKKTHTKESKEDIHFFFNRTNASKVLPCIKINYQIPYPIEGLDNQVSVVYKLREEYPFWYLENRTISKSRFIQSLLDKNFFLYLDLDNQSGSISEERLLDAVLNEIIDSNILSNLQKFSLIKQLRINPAVSIKKSNNSIDIFHFNLEFFVNNHWLKWNQLSDGTRRMFYIITELATLDKGTYLLEEPELGIHPHQLSRLMDFIKEQSESKQIILTTHSPEVLNTLGRDELDRIIVARYDKEKGTQLRHLSEDDIKFAKDYMKNELFLSDYWVMSGFETEEENV